MGEVSLPYSGNTHKNTTYFHSTHDTHTLHTHTYTHIHCTHQKREDIVWEEWEVSLPDSGDTHTTHYTTHHTLRTDHAHYTQIDTKK